MRRVVLTVILFLLFMPLMAEEYVCHLEITNEAEEERVDIPVVLSLSDLALPFSARSAVVRCEELEIPSQMDDLNNDGQMDELAFVVDMPAGATRSLQVLFSSRESTRQYPSRVYAEMLLRGDKENHQPIHSLTIPGSSDIYNLLHHHGPAFESELVAYRIYFDRKQTVDIYGKFNKGLEIEESQFYPTDEQLAKGFGDDVLRVSGSCGLGTLKGWNGKKAVHIDPVESRTESVLAYGPVRTIVDVDVKKWAYQGSLLNMKVRYLLYAGHRDCEVQVSFDRPLRDELFACGVQQIKDSDSFYDNEGLVACWGTDWPVNDTVKYAKETVGLAACLPKDIIKEKKEDGTNYLYTLSLEGRSSFSYHISFTSLKESFGYASREEWFAYVQRWKKELEHPVRITIKKQ